MSDNYLLDLSLVRESNEYWFEDIDTSCPYCSGECPGCDGTGSINCGLCGGDGCEECNDQGTEDCPDCEGRGERESDDCEECDSNGNFEILWDTAFMVPYLKSGIDFSEARKIAWDMGWLLFEYDNEKWIAAGSCGYDFTWVRANCILEICGDLPSWYAEELRSGGQVFVSPEQRTAIATAAAAALEYAVKRAQSSRDDMLKIASYGPAVQNIHQHEREIQRASDLVKAQAEQIASGEPVTVKIVYRSEAYREALKGTAMWKLLPYFLRIPSVMSLALPESGRVLSNVAEFDTFWEAFNKAAESAHLAGIKDLVITFEKVMTDSEQTDAQIDQTIRKQALRSTKINPS